MIDADSTAARVCSACGLCCNGVLFRTVHLKPGDSAKALSSHGLKLKKKQRQRYIPQPCQAYLDCACSIYLDRPTRCRLFECRQLLQLRAGRIVEPDAMVQIEEAKHKAAVLGRLLEQFGNTKYKRPLFQRCDSVLAEPMEALDSESKARRQALQQAKRDLELLLDQSFRVEPDSLSIV